MNTERQASSVVLLLGAILGLAWYGQAIGWHTIDPTRLGWLSEGDSASHLLGWLYFRHEPWALPLGTISGLLHPVGTSVGFTDANPWVSMLLKPIAGWLPADFQFIGPWLALCFALQGVFGARLMQRLTSDPVHQVLGAALFVLAPPLLLRTGHDTLSAQWLILAVVCLHLRPQASRGTVSWAFVLNGLAAGIHPYLAVMLLPLTMAIFVQLRGSPVVPSSRRAALLSAAVVAQTAGIFALFGYFRPSVTQGTGGFGYFSADLLTFVNAMGHSRWLPMLPAGPGQYEGFAFLGSGAIALAVAGIAYGARTRYRPRVPPRLVPLVVAALVMAGFALSHTITVAGFRVLSIRTLYGPVMPLVDPFRSSGRFIWPLFYLVTAAIIAAIVCRSAVPRRTATILLAMAVGLQAAEVSGAWPGGRVPQRPWPALDAPAWATLGPPYRHLVLYPPFHAPAPDDTPCEASPLAYPDVVRLSHLAYRAGMTVNSASVARASLEALGTYCRELQATVRSGRLASDAVYVVAEPSLELFTRAGMACGTLDGFHVCVSGAVDDPVRKAILDAGLAGGGQGAPP